MRTSLSRSNEAIYGYQAKGRDRLTTTSKSNSREHRSFSKESEGQTHMQKRRKKKIQKVNRSKKSVYSVSSASRGRFLKRQYSRNAPTSFISSSFFFFF